MSDKSDLIEEIHKDHKEIKDCYHNYKAAKDPEEAKKWFNQFIWFVCTHIIAKEMVLYTTMESTNDKGKALGEMSREDHRDLKQLLEDLRTEKDEDELEKKFDAAFRTLSEHMAMEEGEILPFVKEHIPLEKRQAASKTYAMRKFLAPTKPHPWLPDKSTALETGLGLIITPIDKLRDMFKSYPE